MSKIMTASGWMDYRDPEQDFRIEEIARSLSRIVRFLGHGEFPTTVAEHSVLVSEILESEGHDDLALQGLLHDAAEAFMADVPSPLKRLPELERYRTLEDELLGRILQNFGEPPVLHGLVHRVDRQATQAEAIAIFGERARVWAKDPYPLEHAGLAIHGWEARTAEKEFLNRFWRLGFWRLA